MSRGRRYDTEPKLNIKKVIAFIVAIAVVILFIASIKSLFTKEDKPREIVTATSYYSAFQNGKWGVIDNKGEVVIPLSYDEMVAIPDNSKDIFVAITNANYSAGSYTSKVLNRQNKEILTEYKNVQTIQNQKNNTIWYEKDILQYEDNGKHGLIKFDGKKISEELYDDVYGLEGVEHIVVIQKDGKYGLVSSSTGTVIIEPEYDEIKSLDPNSYEYGFIVKNSEGNFGVFNANSKQVLEFDYREIKQVANSDYFVVRDANEANEPWPLKVIDKNGATLIASEIGNTPRLDDIVSINGRNAIFKQDNYYGLITFDGIVMIDPDKYTNMKFAGSELLIAKTEDGNYGLINLKGETKAEFDYLDMNYVKEAGIIVAEKQDFKTDILDSTGKVALSGIIVSDLNLDKGYIRVRQDNNYKYYNFKLEEKTPQEVMPTNTLFLYKENGKYGYKNMAGKLVVDCKYDDALEQNACGYSAVKKDGKWGVIKSDGNVAKEPSINLDNNLVIDFINDWYLTEDASIVTYTK